MLRATLATARRLPVSTTISRRNYELLATPPRVHIPFWEKVTHGLVIASLVLGYPCWVMYHVPYYIKVGTGEIQLDK